MGESAVVGKKILQFKVDGKTIFDGKMHQDFEHELPVRGTLQLDKQYEVKEVQCTTFNSGDEWYPGTLIAGQWYSATLTRARADGRYEAELLMPPDQYGNQKKVYYPLLEARHIHDPFTKEVAQVPSTMIRLAVKKDAALFPELTVNGHSFMSYVCVSSPPANGPPADIELMVNEDRTNVIGNVGHLKLKEALEGKVRSKTCEKSKLKSEWKLQIGAFGEHHIVAETKSKKSKEVSVTIDGHRVVGGSAADLGRFGGWRADIAIQGKLALKYNLCRTNASGVARDERTTVTKNLLFSNTITVSVPDHSNLNTAMLECDDVDFVDLEQYKVLPEERMIDDSLETLEMTHGISVPSAVDDDIFKAGMASDLAKLVPGWDSASSLAKMIPPWSASDVAKLVPGGISLLGIVTSRTQHTMDNECEDLGIDDEIPGERTTVAAQAA